MGFTLFTSIRELNAISVWFHDYDIDMPFLGCEMWINFVRMRSENAPHLHSWHTTKGNQKCRLCEFPYAENNYFKTHTASFLTHNKNLKSREITLSKHSYSVCANNQPICPKQDGRFTTGTTLGNALSNAFFF